MRQSLQRILRNVTLTLTAITLAATHAHAQRVELRGQRDARATLDSTLRALTEHSFRFFDLWDTQWRQSQMQRWKTPDGKQHPAPALVQISPRASYQHCHDPSYASVAFDAPIRFPGEYTNVRGPNAFSTCPTWLLGRTSEYLPGMTASESDSNDVMIHMDRIDGVRTARLALIDEYAKAQQRFPDNSAIAAQHVRFLVEQSMLDSALFVSRSCGGDLPFCLLLQGFVESRRGRIDNAGLLFDAAAHHMPREDRCGWRDIQLLLPDSVTLMYNQLSCTPRQQMVAKYWWLADPLYSDSVNERLVEHQSRVMRLMLLEGLPRDARYRYRDRDGSLPQAFRKTIIRFGWPTYMGWGGDVVDGGHNGWLKRYQTDSFPPYTTYEYSTTGRVHTTPSLSTINWTMDVADSSWNINAGPDDKRAWDWWPSEHMYRARRLLTLPSYQIAMLRRDTSVLLASAHDISASELTALRSGANATLLVTSAPDSVFRLEDKRLINDSIVRMRGHIRSGRTLFAMELRDSMPLGLDARTRIGIDPPKTLRGMAKGTIALSDPIVLEMRDRNAGPLQPGEALLDRMLGSTTISLSNDPRIGVFFESYGVSARDTVSVSVSLHRRENLSAFRRLGMAIRVADDVNASVTIKWTEPNAAHVVRTVTGAVPIQSRAVALDISGLSPGPYEIVVGIQRGSQPVVTSSRWVTVTK
jgi:hypothetical protein